MHPTNDLLPSRLAPAPLPLRPDHHLWRNGRLWWIAIVLLDVQGRHFRLRRSLGTDDIVLARDLRDRFLARLMETPHLRPSSPDLAAALTEARAPGSAATGGARTGPRSPRLRVA